jgi:N-acetylmuramic acid 6-phosphate etherase
MNTERPSPRYTNLDLWEPADILDAMIEGQLGAVAAVRAVGRRAGGNRHRSAAEGRRTAICRRRYSGRLAAGQRRAPTFSWPEDRLLLLWLAARTP